MIRETRLAGSLLVIALIASSRADVQVLTPTKDNTLYQDTFNRNLSNGVGQYVFVGTTAVPPPDGDIRRAVIQFDVASIIPAGSTINSVTLTMSMSKTISGPKSVTLHRLSRAWGEGASNAPGEEGGGAPAAPGDATWRHAFFETDLWQNAGGDFASASSGAASIAGVGSYTWSSTSQMVADVQSWLEQPVGNFGWLLRGPEAVGGTAKRFDSREHPTPGNRPRLTIDFTPITDCNNNGIDDAGDIDNGTSDDCNGNGVPDECDNDRDGDGVIDDCDACPDDPNKSDRGMCGCGNADADSDGDGVPDCIDICPGRDDFLDSDGDGVVDCLDDCPDDPNKTDPGDCGCGNADIDSDGDGVLDCDDICPDQDDLLDSDGDGVVDCLDDCPDDPNKTVPGMFGCGVAEADSDNDGVPDVADRCPGQDDNADDDADGVPNCLDGCPNDRHKTEPGDCGCGEADTDRDGDQIPNCIDNCPDVFNPEQTDRDGDTVGDACDTPDQPDQQDPPGMTDDPEKVDEAPDDSAMDMPSGNMFPPADNGDATDDDSTEQVDPQAMPRCGGDMCGMGVVPTMPCMLIGMGWLRGRDRRRRRKGEGESQGFR